MASDEAHRLLEVTPDASDEEVRRAYLSAIVGPTAADETRFKELVAAYELIDARLGHAPGRVESFAPMEPAATTIRVNRFGRASLSGRYFWLSPILFLIVLGMRGLCSGIQ